MFVSMPVEGNGERECERQIDERKHDGRRSSLLAVLRSFNDTEAIVAF